MKSRILALLPLAVMTQLACQALSNLVGSSGSPAGSAGDYQYIFDTSAEPIAVTVKLDAGKTAQATIPLEGGELSTSGADGTVYTLVVPSDALLVETEISLTPAASVSGMPFGGEQTYAVQLAPEGLFLQNFAVLTINPTQELPVDQQILFGYRGDGENLALAIPVVDSQEIKIQLLHFSGYGVTNGSLADVAPVRENLGGDVDGRMESAVGEGAQNERQGEGMGAQQMANVLEQHNDQVLKPRIQAGIGSCAEGQQLLISIMSAMRQAQLLGAPVADTLYDEWVSLLPVVGEVCLEEEYALCTGQHIVHRIIPAWLSLERQSQLGLPIGPELIAQARQYVEQCLRFDLVLESTIVTGTPEDGFESRVKSTLPLRFSTDGLKYLGQAPLVNDFFEYRDGDPDCTETSIRGGGTFEFAQIGFVVERATPTDPLGHVKDLTVNYFPGETSETYGYSCPDTSYGPETLPLWSGMFIAAHGDELSAEGGFTATEWEIFGGEYYAKKEWQIDDTDLEILEVGTFKLYHRPGS